MRMGVKVYACLSMSLLLTGCVGPMTPFGSISWSNSRQSGVIGADNSLDSPKARVRFIPDRQVLHNQTTFSVVVEDASGVPEDFKLAVYYNGIDVSDEFLAHAEITVMDPMRHELKLTTKFLRLLPGRDNDIKVVYQRGDSSGATVANYLPPTCSAFANNQMLFLIPEFDPPPMLLQLINQSAQQKSLNPFFVAALVAQESSFDPLAVSRKRAIGLTQITSLGEGEIVKRYNHWPRYPGVDDMPIPFLKLLILNGRIHSGNEWRLDPAMSIQGGVEYLNYLTEFWKRPERRTQIETKVGISDSVISEVLLASYNSGAKRVSDAINSRGGRWLASEELGETQRYVRRVMSFCDHFEHQED